MELGAREPDGPLDKVLRNLSVNECCTLVYTVSYRSIKICN